MRVTVGEEKLIAPTQQSVIRGNRERKEKKKGSVLLRFLLWMCETRSLGARQLIRGGLPGSLSCKVEACVKGDACMMCAVGWGTKWAAFPSLDTPSSNDDTLALIQC